MLASYSLGLYVLAPTARSNAANGQAPGNDDSRNGTGQVSILVHWVSWILYQLCQPSKYKLVIVLVLLYIYLAITKCTSSIALGVRMDSLFLLIVYAPGLCF